MLKEKFARNKLILANYRRFKLFCSIPLKAWKHPSLTYLFLKISPYTLLNYARLYNAYHLAQNIIRKKIEGGFVECGVWKGGCMGVMGIANRRKKESRDLWLFDSFIGLKKPTEKDGEKGKLYIEGSLLGRSTQGCVASVKEVKDLLFSKLNLDNVHIIKGWVEDTLPVYQERIGKISILRIDLDFYKSTKFCLYELYDNIVDGGYIIIDDYYDWEGCKTAVDEFLNERNLHPEIIQVDYSACYFEKR